MALRALRLAAHIENQHLETAKQQDHSTGASHLCSELQLVNNAQACHPAPVWQLLP
jgi:hypothetical protein